MEKQLLHIMYAPHGYIQEKYLHALPMNPLAKYSCALLNQLIIEHYQLNTSIDIPQSTVLQTFIKGWYSMPKVALLIGCYLMRSTVLFSGVFYRLDPISRAFIALPLKSSVHTETLLPCSIEKLIALGSAVLQAQLAVLSPALAERAKLFLPETELAPLLVQANVLTLAFDYAQIS